MFGYNAVQFIGSIITVAIALLVFYAVARHSSTSAAKKALLLGLLLICLFVTMADSCDSTVDGVVASATCRDTVCRDACPEGNEGAGCRIACCRFD